MKLKSGGRADRVDIVGLIVMRFTVIFGLTVTLRLPIIVRLSHSRADTDSHCQADTVVTVESYS